MLKLLLLIVPCLIVWAIYSLINMFGLLHKKEGQRGEQAPVMPAEITLPASVSSSEKAEILEITAYSKTPEYAQVTFSDGTFIVSGDFYLVRGTPHTFSTVCSTTRHLYFFSYPDQELVLIPYIFLRYSPVPDPMLIEQPIPGFTAAVP